MKVIVYLEGPSDRDALRALFESLIRQAAQNGCLIRFIPLDGKQQLMTKVPRRAVNILRNHRDAHVFALPDLYPPNVGHPHSSDDDLKRALFQAFGNECKRLHADRAALGKRFHVHCLKYDLEVLLLASEEQLRKHLGLRSLPSRIKWVKPVEDQDHKRPPKRVIEALFQHAKRCYIDTIHAPMILQGVDPFDLAKRCPQCFKPFLDNLLGLAGL